MVGEERDIHIKSNGIATLNTPPFSTDGRTTLQFQLAKVDISNFGLPTPRTFMISVYGADGQKQYEAYAGYELVDNKGIITAILPKLNNVNKIEIKNIADDTDYDELRLYNFSLTATVDTDWDYKARYSQFRMPVTYLNTVSETDTASEVQRVRDYYSEEEYYGIKHLYAFGIVSSEGAQAQIEVSSNDILRFINPNKEPQAVTVGTKEYWLSYGESDIKLETVVSGAQLTLPPAEKRVMVLQKMSKGNEIENKNNIPYYQIDGLNTKPIMSEDLEVLYYLNKYDQSKLYAYDVNTGKSTKCTDAVFDSLVDVKGKRYVLADRGSDRLLYDLQEGTETLCSGELTVPDYSLSKDYTSLKKASHLTGQGDVFHVFDYDRVTYLYQIQNGEFLKIYESNRYTSSGSFYDPELVFDASGNNMALYYNFTDKMPTIILFKKTDGVWTQTKTITLSDESSSFKFSNDANKLYFNRESKIYELDLKTDAEKELQEGSISMVCGDGRLLYIDADETYYYLYNPVNGERQRITQYSIVSGTDVWYSPDYNQIVYIAPNNMLARYILGSDKPLERYLLSFDGCASWYAFRGGRWLLASQSLKPSTEELSLNGMTAEELNAIKPVDFEKLYQNDTEVVTVHVAIYMTSNSNKVSPAISNITVQTVANQVEERLAAASYQGYNKADYRKINAIFPIENFRKPAECYYILALGNDWLYTYKEGKLVRLPLGADEIAEDVTQNWIEIKQYGMTAGELRNIPDDALNDLLLNENYANTEFGIIYVVRPDDISTEPYKVEFRIQADAQYFNYENMVMEITVNGIGMTFTTPDDLSKDAIDQFMSWLSGRQNGKGDIFYHLQTSGGQYFINYFMISNVNVYNKATYNPIVPSVFSEIADEQEEDTELEVSDPEVSDSADPSELE